MSVPERAKKWLTPNIEPELTPMQLGIKFAALVRLLDERPDILNGRSLGLAPDFGVPVRYTDDLMGATFSYTYDSAKWQSTFVMQGRLRHFTVLMEALRTSSKLSTHHSSHICFGLQ